MIIVDKALAAREAEGRPIRVGMIGAGFMAQGIANQIANSVKGMRLAVIANRTLERARRAFAEAGVSDIREIATSAQLDEAISRGRHAITADPRVVCEAEGIDAILEVTGAVEYGARVILRAIDCGKPIVSMNAEVDGTAGPILKRYAERAGVILSGSDGDQPGVQMNLWRFVKGIGVTPLVCGNVKGLQDPYRNPTTQEGFAKRWGQNVYMVTSFADGTKISFEQAIVANATGMTVAVRGMHGYQHSGHVDELTARYDIEELNRLGGIVEYVVGAAPAPGVFVLGTHDDPRQKHYLNLYKLGEGPLFSFYTPYHLCHFEVPLSVARVVLFKDPVIQPIDGPRVDVVATAKVDLHPGDTIDALGGYKTYGQCERYTVAREQNLLPMGLAEGCMVRRAVARDAVLTYDDVVIPPHRVIDRLRAEQDALWPV